MRRINISAPLFEYDDPADTPDGFRSGSARLGSGLGASITGMTIYELPPGQAICPYHYEYGEEEWLLVIEGRPTLRHPEGTDGLEPSDVVFFTTGPDGAHMVRNETSETVRVLMFSNRLDPSACVYPDSDKIGMWTGNRDDDMIALRSSKVGYWAGEGGGAKPG